MNTIDLLREVETIGPSFSTAQHNKIHSLPRLYLEMPPVSLYNVVEFLTSIP